MFIVRLPYAVQRGRVALFPNIRRLHQTVPRLLSQNTNSQKENQEETEQERPEPQRNEDESSGGSSIWTKLILFVGLSGSIGYGFYSHDEQKLRDLGITVATGDFGALMQKAFGVWIRMYGGIRQSLRSGWKYFAEPSKPVLLPTPPQQPLLTLVVDLDETLVHSEWDRATGTRIRRRPYAREFLKRMAQSGAEIVVFSSSSMFFTDGVVAALDNIGTVSYRLGKEYTVYQDGKYIKDLSRLNRDLSRVIIIDDNPEAYSLQPENAIPISPWKGDKSDTALRDLIPFLEHILSERTDVRQELAQYAGQDIPKLFKQKMEERIKKQSKIANILGGNILQAKSAKIPTHDTQQQEQGTEPQTEENVGYFWKWMKLKTQQNLIREQQVQENWMKAQQEQKTPEQ